MFLLASNSPRRKELLKKAGYVFRVEAQAIDESYASNLAVNYIAEHLSTRKNQYHRKLYPSEVIVTADTTVILDDQLLEKPVDASDAYRMLKLLSDNKHKVISGVCVSSEDIQRSFSVETEVEFYKLEDAEINYYINRFKPFDKAGAYGIQEWIGMIGAKKIVGSYYNVVGLPLHELYLLLKNEFQIIPR